MSRIHLAAFAALAAAVLALTSIIVVSNVHAAYDQRDARFVAFVHKSDQDKQRATITHNKAMAAAAIAYEAATRKAVRKQKHRDVKVLRRVVRRMKSRARREAEAARNAGYSAGNRAGFSAGHSTGVDDGVRKASDELTCSDDLDVPLPFCNF
jgi:hypothetical protein